MTPTEIQTETETVIKPEVHNNAPLDIPAAHQAAVQRAIEIALEAVKHERGLRIPRDGEDRANGFALWLARKRQQHEPMMRAAVTEAFANVAPLDEMTLRKYVDCCVWPEAEYWLQTIALRYHAGAWLRKRMGDATYMSMPERLGAFWRVPLGVNGYGRNLGQIVLDNEANIIDDLTTTPQEIQEKLRDRKFSPAETIARQ